MNVVDVLVPVLDRPRRARPFMDSLRATVPDGDVAVIALPPARDRRSIRTWQRAGAVVAPYPGYPGTFAEKANYGYRWAAEGRTPAPWLLLVGDDVAFHPGWLHAALDAAEATGASVVGTNDLGERDDGEQAVHPLIRRSYIADLGASWDGPGVVCHEGYRHNFTDAELAHVARDRKVWAPAPRSVIEHMHWRFDRSGLDSTYELGASSLPEDAALYAERAERYGRKP